MPEKIAIIYWVEGAGHAARAIPVANELRDRGHDVLMAGNGPGQRFVELNGFESPELAEINFSDNIRDPDVGKIEFLREFFTGDIPSLFRRYRQIKQLLNQEEPDKLVTDDLFAALAAIRSDTELYRIDHVMPEYFTGITRLSSKVYNYLSLVFGEKIFITSLWDIDERDGYIGVGPLAQEGEGEVEEFDVLLIPGSWSDCFDELKEKLEDKGLDVRMVGDDDWETKPAMTPYTGAADCVICTGYSSIADSVVAGTPCVVYPFMPIQKSIAAAIDEHEPEGVKTVDSVEGAVEAAREFVDSGIRVDYENGAPEFADRLTED